MTLTLKSLDVRNPDELNVLQQVMAGTPSYCMLIKGHMPTQTEAKETLYSMPPGNTPDGRIVGVFMLNNQAIGCVILCQSYPQPNTAYMGLMLITDEYQNLGFGKKALELARSIAREWSCETLRIAVNARNKRALKFWEREGFGELNPHDVNGNSAKIIVMERDS